ncbi:hypothetical protein A6E01_18955 (plasmid) [Vibrio breoganii]|uniref:Flagellar protein FlgJ N-terminal domain-containing protein n=1 Tax=Vibrio breoganii TaxID=553239 RepID=A0AAN0XZ42_9VIBR|nr:rod-binding protein [Vibrio breoganii]ANO35294.1 hypothetical protein A6E01_18955 [Vibrio breoganii]
MISPIASVVIDTLNGESVGHAEVITPNAKATLASPQFVSFEEALQLSNQERAGRSGSVLDNTELRSLQGRGDSPAKIARVAVELETVYMQMVFKTMRDSAKAFEDKDSPLSSANDGMFKDVLDQQMVSNMNRNGGSVGLAESLYVQMSRNFGNK